MLSVIGIFVVSFITPLFNIYFGINNEVEAKSISNTLYNEIFNKIQYLEEFSINNTDSTKFTYKLIDKNTNEKIDGKKIAKEVFPNTDYDIIVNFSSTNQRLIKITITVSGKGEDVFKMDRTILPPNLTLQ